MPDYYTPQHKDTSSNAEPKKGRLIHAENLTDSALTMAEETERLTGAVPTHIIHPL